MKLGGEGYQNENINLLPLFYPQLLVQTEKETSWKEQGG